MIVSSLVTIQALQRCRSSTGVSAFPLPIFWMNVAICESFPTSARFACQNVRSLPGRLENLSLVWPGMEKRSQSNVLKYFKFYSVGQAFSRSVKFSGYVTGYGGSDFFPESII
jgi:hypothetical protein